MGLKKKTSLKGKGIGSFARSFNAIEWTSAATTKYKSRKEDNIIWGRKIKEYTYTLKKHRKVKLKHSNKQ